MDKENNVLDKSVDVKPKNDPQVTISKSDLEKLISTVEKQAKDINLLYEVADKSRLAKAQSGPDGASLIKTVKVSVWPDNNKFIISWKNTKNVSEIVGRVWVEDQRTLLVFDDGTNTEISLLDFYRKPTKQKVEVLSRQSDDSSGKIVKTYKVRFADGRELEIGEDFIN